MEDTDRTRKGKWRACRTQRRRVRVRLLSEVDTPSWATGPGQSRGARAPPAGQHGPRRADARLATRAARSAGPGTRRPCRGGRACRPRRRRQVEPGEARDRPPRARADTRIYTLNLRTEIEQRRSRGLTLLPHTHRRAWQRAGHGRVRRPHPPLQGARRKGVERRDRVRAGGPDTALDPSGVTGWAAAPPRPGSTCPHRADGTTPPAHQQLFLCPGQPGAHSRSDLGDACAWDAWPRWAGHYGAFPSTRHVPGARGGRAAGHGASRPRPAVTQSSCLRGAVAGWGTLGCGPQAVGPPGRAPPDTPPCVPCPGRPAGQRGLDRRAGSQAPTIAAAHVGSEVSPLGTDVGTAGARVVETRATRATEAGGLGRARRGQGTVPSRPPEQGCDPLRDAG